LVKIIYIVAKKQVGNVIQAIFEQGWIQISSATSTMFIGVLDAIYTKWFNFLNFGEFFLSGGTMLK